MILPSHYSECGKVKRANYSSQMRRIDNRDQAATEAATENATVITAMEMRFSPLHLNVIPAPNGIANAQPNRAPRLVYQCSAARSRIHVVPIRGIIANMLRRMKTVQFTTHCGFWAAVRKKSKARAQFPLDQAVAVVHRPAQKEMGKDGERKDGRYAFV